MSYHQENSVVFSLDNLRALAGATPSGRRRLATLGPGEATSFLNLASLNGIEGSPATLHSPSMLIAPIARRASHHLLFPALVSLGLLLLLFSGLALAVMLKKLRAQQASPQLVALISEKSPLPAEAQLPTQALVEKQERGPQAKAAASDHQPAANQASPVAQRKTVAESKSRRVPRALQARRARSRLARQRQLRRTRSQRKMRPTQRRAGTRVAARSTRKPTKKAQELDSLLLGF